MKLYFFLFYYHDEGHVAAELKYYRIFSLQAKDNRNNTSLITEA
jgi:hypothetical protein